MGNEFFDITEKVNEHVQRMTAEIAHGVVPPDEGVTGVVLRTRRPFMLTSNPSEFVSALRAGHRAFAEKYPIHSVLPNRQIACSSSPYF